MKLRVQDISAETRRLAFLEPREEINRAIAGAGTVEYELEGAVEVNLTHYRAGLDFFFEGQLRIHAKALCSRCAEWFALEDARPFRFVLTPAAAGETADRALRAEDLEHSVYQGEEIDLSALIQEQVVLGIPSKLLCDEACRGLCLDCGINLNNDSCTCNKRFEDPRLAPLRLLKTLP